MVSSFNDRGCSCLSRWPHFMGHRWAFMCALFNAYLSAHISWVFLRSSDWCDVMWCHHHGSFCGQSKWWLSASRSLMSLAAQLTSTVTYIILLSDVSMICCTGVSYCTVMSVQGLNSSRLACKPCYDISPLLHFIALVKLLASLRSWTACQLAGVARLCVVWPDSSYQAAVAHGSFCIFLLTLLDSSSFCSLAGE